MAVCQGPGNSLERPGEVVLIAAMLHFARWMPEPHGVEQRDRQERIGEDDKRGLAPPPARLGRLGNVLVAPTPEMPSGVPPNRSKESFFAATKRKGLAAQRTRSGPLGYFALAAMRGHSVS